MELTNIEKEFYLAITGHNYDPNYMDGETQRSAKAAAALCERKIRQAIELAREKKDISGLMATEPHYVPKYTSGEIMKKVSEPPKDLTEKKTT